MEEVRKFRSKNGEEITIRPARPDDASMVINTLRSSALERSYVLMDQYGKDVEAEKKYIAAFDRSKDLLVVAVEGGDVVGTLAAVRADKGNRPEISHIISVGLHIREKHRGQGIGAELLKYATDWAKEQGYEKLEASIFTTNQRSLHVFSRAGFTQECLRRKRIRIGADLIDEVCMGKFID